jgi:hypothetical protein
MEEDIRILTESLVERLRLVNGYLPKTKDAIKSYLAYATLWGQRQATVTIWESRGRLFYIVVGLLAVFFGFALLDVARWL